MTNALQTLLTTYVTRRMAVVLMLGFASGLPLALSGSTLSYWLAGTGVSKTDIGLFALVGLSYSLKFVWSPLFDHVAAPFVLRSLGRRRGWLVATQIGLMAALLLTGASDPAVNAWATALAAVLVAFFSASQDIVIDAYRVELLKDEEQGAGGAVVIYGYRLGMLASGAGAVLLSSYFGWFIVYAVMAALSGLCLLAVLLSPEPPSFTPRTQAARPAERLRMAVIDPFVEFARRRHWLTILLFVVAYKLCDAVAGVMAMPFYREMGFTAEEIATVTKLFGLIATLVGVFAGGWTVARMGLLGALLIGAVVQMLSNWVFALQALAGHDVTLLTVTIFIENFAGGIGTAAFVAFLSGLCAREFTATHYALLSSLASVGRTSLSAGGGWLADQMDWVAFFLVTGLAALPALALLMLLARVGAVQRKPAG